MEKRTPHCKLAIVKEFVAQGKIRFTNTAFHGGLDMGFEYGQMIKVVANLTNTDFYKSMTTHENHRVWQDVYRPTTELGDVYLKLTVIDDVLVVSFKEL